MASIWRSMFGLALACLLVQANAAKMQQHSHNRMNPIRKVVNLLMAMQKKVEAEGHQNEELFEKFQCNVKGVLAGLEKSIADAQERIPQLEASIKETSAEHQQLAEDLKQAKEDRDKAEKAISTANAIRGNEEAEFAKESSNQKADLEAIKKAVAALEKGGSGAFLQTKASDVLRRLSMSTNIDLGNADRDLLSNFLQGGGQEPSSGEILGILKQMHDEMSSDLATMVQDEERAIGDHDALVTAKKKEARASTKAIEVKTGRKGELAVELTKLNNDLEDRKEGLEEDGKFLGQSKQSQKAKEADYEAYKKTQAEELVALADTIKVLNDDDALDLFKKTLPSPAASFIQMPVTNKQMKRDALRVLHGARHRGHKKGHSDPRLDLLALWVQGRKGGNFDEVLQKIDSLIANLKKEQGDDETKKGWCLTEVDKTEEEVKWTARAVSDVEKVIASSKEDLKAVLGEIAEVTNGIKELDKSVEEATRQRKAEHTTSTNSLAENGAAKQLLQMANDRLNKFYNPKLVEAKPEPAAAALVQEDSDDGDSSEEAPSFVQVKLHSALSEDDGSTSDDGNAQEPDEQMQYTKPKGAKEESSGVLQMISTLKQDVSLQIQEIDIEEKESQKDYEIFMKDSSDKRAIDSKSVADKEAAKAKIETELQKAKVKKGGEEESLAESEKELMELHNDCDWLLKNFDARKSAREDEADALTKARAVLSGADYS
jgi:septal ring factor EnvC (AmiA/AmiB activator)